MEGKLACNPDSRSFFVSLPIQPNPNTGFRVGFREELFPEKLPP